MAKVTKERIENDAMPVFRKRFRELVDDAENQTEFAKMTGFSRQSIGYWYNGPRVPDAAGLLKLSEKCHCSIDWLLGRVNDDNRTDDQKISDMAEYTDLSSDAIKELHIRPQMGHVVSGLLATRNGQHLIEYIGRYLFPLSNNDDIEIEFPSEYGSLSVAITDIDKKPLIIKVPGQGNFAYGREDIEATFLNMITVMLMNIKGLQKFKE